MAYLLSERILHALLSERTLNTVLGLGAFLILASAFVISTLNPTGLSPLWHLGIMVVTTVAFYYAGYVIRQTLRLARAGAALLAIEAGMIPLDTWTLRHEQFVAWTPDAVWLLASTLCLAVYLASHAILRDRSFAVLTALAGGSALLAFLHALRLPSEWGLALLVALAMAYLTIDRYLPERWAVLGWALSWAARVATPLVLAGLMALKVSPPL